MSVRFVTLTAAEDKTPLLVNPDHVRYARPSGPNAVTLFVSKGEGSLVVEGDLESVQAALTKKPHHKPHHG